MLQEVMEYIHNYFVPIKAVERTYAIESGMITPSFDAEDGDRFLICGSRRNDGVYTWHADGIKNDDDKKAAGLRDETFAGTIRVCSVPPALLALSEEIITWVATYSDMLNSPIGSETFNGYSYTLKSGRIGAGGASAKPMTWRDQFAGSLERWRKPCL